ncbi:MAG: hypothetical protein GXO76_08565 [Calditrichaeota bacterium]|nr:hypothetical protein [Calditrichota bacterium]
MISCDQFSSLITDYLDGFIGGKKKSQFEEHLMACESCRAKMQRVKLVQKQLREMPVVHASPTFDIVLKSRIRQELEREGFFEHILNVLLSTKAPAYGLAVLSLLFVSFFAVNQFFLTGSSKQHITRSYPQMEAKQSETVSPVVEVARKPVVEEHVRYVLDEVAVSQTPQSRTGINSVSLSEHRNDSVKRASISSDSTGPAIFPSMPMGRAVSVIF